MARLEEFCLFPMKLCGIKRQGNDGDEDDDDDDDDDDGDNTNNRFVIRQLVSSRTHFQFLK